MPGYVSENKGIQFLRILFQWWGIEVNDYMLRNVSKTLGDIVESITKAMDDLEISLNLLAQVDSDNWIAFDYILAEQGDVCVLE